MNKIYKYKYIILGIMVCFMLLSGCNNIFDENGNELNRNYNDSSIITYMNKIIDITPFKTAEQVDEFETAPCLFIQEKKTYLIRNFPSDLKDGSKAINYFIENNTLTKQIEVYTNYDYSKPSEIILLGDIQDREIVFYHLYYYRDKDCYYIIGKENVNNEYRVKLYRFTAIGNLISETELSISSIHDIVICNNGCYEIRKNDTNRKLIRLDMETLTENNVDEEVVIAFRSDEQLYYIKKEISETDTFDYKLYLYTQNGDIDLIQGLIIDENKIFTAAYDNVNKGLYFADTSNLYYYQDGTTKKILTAIDSYINVKSCYNQVLWIKIGHNQLSLYHMEPGCVEIVDD